MAPKTEVRTGSSTSKSSSLPVSQKLLRLAKTTQLYWFSAHVASLVSFVAWQVFGLFSKRQAQNFSRLTLFFQLVCYGIVIRQSVPWPKTGSKIQLLRNENVQYIAFAAVLFLSSLQLPPWTKAVSPFIVYSFFHAITYFQKNLLEYLPVSLHVQASISDRITYIASNFNVQALYFAALSELMLLLDIVFGVPGLLFSVFRNPLYVIFFILRSFTVVVFLKLRYDQSQYTKQAVQQLDARISGVLQHPMAPAQLRALYYGPVKSTVLRYANLVSIPKSTSVKKSQ